jgi:glycosyltransferase involved in cell wall biosynthesis
MHIVQILPELNQGGVERGTAELSRELVKRGHRSTVISAGGTLVEQIEKDGGRHITLDVCSKNPLTVPLRVFQFRKTLRGLSQRTEIGGQRTEDRDRRSEVEGHPPTTSNQQPATWNQPHSGMVLHARSRVPAWLCYFANKKMKLPFITTVHGFNSVNRYSKIMTQGDLVLYGSTAIRDYILKNYHVDASKLRYVPRGIDTDYFDPDKTDSRFVSEFKKKYGLENRFVISMVGRITEWKGHDTFIRALAEVQKYQPDVVGVAAGGIRHGKKDYFQELEKLAKDLGAPICFAGSQTQVRDIYALSHLVVSAASSKTETFGRAAAEALAMNTPVVASAHGGSLDILLDGENGLLFEPGNARDLAEKIRTARSHRFQNMREHIQKNFSLNHMTETELDAYHELTDR